MPSQNSSDPKPPNDDEEKQLVKVYTQAESPTSLPHHQNGTLLPGPLATLISAGTGIGALSVRAGTRIAGWGLYAGRESTLKGLSLGKNAAETILLLAGRDMRARADSELSQQDAIHLLARGLDMLNWAISTTSFAAATSFQATEYLLNSMSGSTEKVLSMLNSVFGSTESSKAVAAVIRLLTNELNKPEAGEVLKYLDILGAVVSFVLLQRWGRRKTQLEFRNAGGEETIWDTVIDDKGFRADVVGTRRQETVMLNAGHVPPTMAFTSPEGDEEFEALERGTLFGAPHAVVSSEDHLTLSDDEIYSRIASQLPDEATVTITTETIQARTIRVEIRHNETAHVEAPPGTIMVAERLNHDHFASSDGPSQTIIFRTALKRTNSAEIGPNKQLHLTPRDDLADSLDHEDSLMMGSTKVLTSEASNSSRSKGLSDESDPERLDRDDAPQGQSSFLPVANQKKSRKPVFGNSTMTPTKIPLAKSPPKDKPTKTIKQDTGKKFRKALKTLSPSSSVAAMKDAQNVFPRRRNESGKPLPNLPRFTPASNSSHVTPPRIYPMPSLSNGHSPISTPLVSQSPQQTVSTSYFAVQHRRRDSTVSQTDTYSVHSESRPGSPTFTRTHTRTVSGIPKTKSDIGLSAHETESRLEPSGSSLHHQRTRSFVPSLYSMASKHSGEAVVLQPRKPVPRKSIYEDSKMIDALMNEGKVPGIFPDRHLVKTVRRFARFATASYGSGFLRFMGLTPDGKPPGDSTELTALDVQHHDEHASFSTHTGLPPETIMLSSFYDPRGVTGNAEWSASAISPLIHFISIDHESKAVVLTCRGTLGFEDILTDMTCDYDDILWQGQSYKVHRGIHASARRMLGGSGSRVMATIKASLEEYPEYGFVLCGHSLGGSVAAILAILIAEPTHSSNGQAFVTKSPTKLLTDTNTTNSKTDVPPITLPPGRPIHVYSYGTPATVSEPLRVATRGLITTVVGASDIFPTLSLGTLHDFRTVALHLKHDTSDAYNKMMTRIWKRIRSWLHIDAEAMQPGPPLPEDIAGDGVGEDQWAWKLLQTLRESMTNFKLVPAGEVFILETTRVFDRLGADVKQEARFGADVNDDNKTEQVFRALGRPATRVQFKWVRDVEGRFAELRFGRDMFSDHHPGKYESGLGALEMGVCDE